MAEKEATRKAEKAIKKRGSLEEGFVFKPNSGITAQGRADRPVRDGAAAPGLNLEIH